MNTYKVKFTLAHCEVTTTVEFANEWNEVAVILRATNKLRLMYGLDTTKAKAVSVEHLGTEEFGVWRLTEVPSDV